MRMRTPVAALAALLAIAAPVAAQPGALPPETTPPPEPTPVQPPDAGVMVDAARVAYQRGFAALLVNDFATARASFAEAAATAADPELRGAAREMGRLTDELEGRKGRIVLDGAGPTTPPPLGTSDSTRDDTDEGRAGIIVTSTLASIYAGAVFSDLADTGDARAITGIVVATTGLGFAASLYGTKGRTIYGGTAEAYSLGMLLGAGNGLLLASPAGAETSEEWNVTVLGSAALVMGAGLYYGQTVKPTRGQVSFAGTMATMGLATVGLGLLIVQPDIDDEDPILLAMAGGLDAGAVAGLALGKDLTWSPGRARLIWLSALLGGLLGGASGILLFGDGESEDGDTEARITAGLTLGGAWGGLLLGAHVTRNMKPDARFRPRPLVELAHHRQLVPIAVPHGGGIGYAGSW